LKRTTWLIGSLLATAALATTFFALAPTQATGPLADATFVKQEISPGPIPGEAALRARINPETGRVEVSTIPAAAVLDPETANALRRDTEGLKQTIHPSGAVSVNLQGRFQNVSVARLHGDGKLVICSEDAEQVEGIAQGRPVATPMVDQTPEVR